MIKKFKVLLSVLICLLLISSCAVAQSKNSTYKNHPDITSLYYSNILEKKIYPLIESDLNKYRKPISKEETRLLLKDVILSINSYARENNISIEIQEAIVYTIAGKLKTYYMLNISISALEMSKANEDFVPVLLYKKTFVIFSEIRNTVKAEI